MRRRGGGLCGLRGSSGGMYGSSMGRDGFSGTVGSVMGVGGCSVGSHGGVGRGGWCGFGVGGSRGRRYGRGFGWFGRRRGHGFGPCGSGWRPGFGAPRSKSSQPRGNAGNSDQGLGIPGPGRGRGNRCTRFVAPRSARKGRRCGPPMLGPNEPCPMGSAGSSSGSGGVPAGTGGDGGSVSPGPGGPGSSIGHRSGVGSETSIVGPRIPGVTGSGGSVLGVRRLGPELEPPSSPPKMLIPPKRSRGIEPPSGAASYAVEPSGAWLRRFLCAVCRREIAHSIAA